MGGGLRARLRRARRAGCCSRARPSAPTSARSPACATTTASRRPTSPTPTPTPSATASAARSPSSPTTACCSGAAATSSSSRPSPTPLTGARGGPALPHRDLPRAARRAAADPRRRARAPRAGARRRPPRRGRPRGGRRRQARARDRQGAAGITGRAPTVVLHTEARAAEKLQAFTRSSRALDRRGQHGQRGRRHPAPARRRLRDGGQDAADLPPDRRALRAHDPRAGAGPRAGSTCPPTRCCARTPPRSSASCAMSCARRPRRTAARSTSSTSGARPSVARPSAFVPVAADVAPQMALFGAPARRRAPVARLPVRARRARRGRRCRPSSAVRCCATSATGSSPTCAAARAAARRDQPLAEPLVRYPSRRGRLASTSSSARSSCSWVASPVDGERARNGVRRRSCPRKR